MVLIFRTIVRFVVVALLVSSCGGDAGANGDVVVVATTSVLGDIASNVLGDAGTVEVLVPIGADPHDYRPSSRQLARLIDVDLVVANGLGLEQGLEEALAAAEADGARVLEVGPELDPLPFADGETPDPHVWMDPVRVAEAAVLMASSLDALAPGGEWRANAEAYGSELRALDDEIAANLAVIPEDRRKLVTNHDSLEYFADRYGLEIIGTVIPGGSTLGDPSAADLAELVAAMEAADVKAIFAETTEPDDLAEAVAAELGADVAVVELFTGSLGEAGTPAGTLAGMLAENARRIAGALG